MRKYCVLMMLFFCFGNLRANDSTCIKFISKTILLQSGEKFLYFSVKKEAFLLIPIPDSDSISCFVFKKNRLMSTGKLVIKKSKESKIALRSGYWRFYDKNQHQAKVYFIDDEPLILNDEIPVEEEK
ncbi:MAG: hypothetical protein JNL69_00810 [Bacteroidia bacterium]|nr:hypothetical protein [Bacteroidia bacterium]